MMQGQADLVVKGGLVVSGTGIGRLDLLVRDGKVAGLAPDIPLSEGQRAIEASGAYVLPGIVDAHNHPVYADRIESFSRSCAFGGITTVIPFIGAVRNWGGEGKTSATVQAFIGEARRTSYLDFSVHAVFTAQDAAEEELPALMDMGVISFKCFMTYPRRGMMMPDDRLVRIMALAARLGGLCMVHAENGFLIDHLVDGSLKQGQVDNEYYGPSQPTIAEAEALFRACTYAEVTGCPLYAVHLSAREVPDLLRYFKRRGLRLFGETCPQYLSLTNDEVVKHGALAKIGPPLRASEDVEAMWEGLRSGALDTVASDSCNMTRQQKRLLAGNMRPEEAPPAGNIFEARFGAPWAEQMLSVVYHKGVNEGRITLPRLVQALCENPAKVFGLYPRKGILQPGSDADFVLFDPFQAHTLGAAYQHTNSDYTPFEGWQVVGKPTLVVQRGQVVVEGERLVRPRGQAEYLPGDKAAAAFAPGGVKVG
ncbi:MAG: amidohydrolase family protein [Chloroflexi bacterium]|nr:amidohydrolase family protein [Chloroflexota bacterium]